MLVGGSRGVDSKANVGSGQNAHLLIVVGIGVGVTRSSRVGDGVLLSGLPRTLPVPLGLGMVALALILESSGLKACSLVATVHTSSRPGSTITGSL